MDENYDDDGNAKEVHGWELDDQGNPIERQASAGATASASDQPTQSAMKKKSSGRKKTVIVYWGEFDTEENPESPEQERRRKKIETRETWQEIGGGLWHNVRRSLPWETVWQLDQQKDYRDIYGQNVDDLETGQKTSDGGRRNKSVVMYDEEKE